MICVVAASLWLFQSIRVYHSTSEPSYIGYIQWRACTFAGFSPKLLSASGISSSAMNEVKVCL